MDEEADLAARRAAKIIEIIKATAEAAKETAASNEPRFSSADVPPWRAARYAAIHALCRSRHADEFAYVTYTLASFGLTDLADLSDHQLEQTYRHLQPLSVRDHCSSIRGWFASICARFFAISARSASEMRNASNAIFAYTRQALSAFFLLLCPGSIWAPPHTGHAHDGGHADEHRGLGFDRGRLRLGLHLGHRAAPGLRLRRL